MRDSVLFKRDLYEALNVFDEETKSKLIYALLKYSFEDEDTKFENIEKGMFILMKFNIDHKCIGKGEIHWNYKGGITPENMKIRNSNEYLKWRREILTRDKFKCVICGSNKDLEVHHIKKFSEFPELRLNIENGVTLCKKCHRELHRK